MADAIRPKDLQAGTPSDTAALIFDNGTQVLKGTPTGLVDAAIPLASQADAEAGTLNSGRMNPLRTAQAVAAQAMAPLAAAAGSGLVGTRRASLLTAAQYRMLSAKLADRFDLRDINGISLNGSNDNTSALQAGANDAAAQGVTLYAPAGIIATSTIQVPQGFSMQGAGRSRGVPATRFLFTDLNPGFVCGDGSDSSGYEDGFLFRDIVTSRMQPAPPSSGTWTAIDAQPDFVMNGSTDLDLEHVLFLNSTRAVNMLGGGGIGRLNMDNCGGQVFVYGVNVELSADTCKFTNIHWWPFWSDTLPVNAFSCANADHFYLKRCDSPQFMNVSSIACRTGFRFAANAQGATSNALITNAALDYATRNIWFDTTCIGASAWISGATFQANNSAGDLANIAPTNPRINIEMQGTNDYLSLVGSGLGGGSGPAVWVHGNSEEAHLSGSVFLHSYGTVSGDPSGGLVANGNNKLILDTAPRVDTPGAGLVYDGDGYISSPSRRAYTPTISYGGSASGQSATATGRYIVRDKWVTVDVDVTITATGTGATDLRLTLPYSSNTEIGTGYGSFYANATNALSVRVVSAQAIITLNNGFPGVVGSFRARFEYPIA